MKTLILAATLGSLSLSFSAPVQAAPMTKAVSLEQLLDGSFGRGGHRCDDPAFAATHPRCTK